MYIHMYIWYVHRYVEAKVFDFMNELRAAKTTEINKRLSKSELTYIFIYQ